MFVYLFLLLNQDGVLFWFFPFLFITVMLALESIIVCLPFILPDKRTYSLKLLNIQFVIAISKIIIIHVIIIHLFFVIQIYASLAVRWKNKFVCLAEQPIHYFIRLLHGKQKISNYLRHMNSIHLQRQFNIQCIHSIQQHI